MYFGVKVQYVPAIGQIYFSLLFHPKIYFSLKKHTFQNHNNTSPAKMPDFLLREFAALEIQ